MIQSVYLFLFDCLDGITLMILAVNTFANTAIVSATYHARQDVVVFTYFGKISSNRAMFVITYGANADMSRLVSDGLGGWLFQDGLS